MDKEGNTRTWDSATGREVEPSPGACDDDVWSWCGDAGFEALEGSVGRCRRGNALRAVSADGRTLVTANGDRRVRRWDAVTMRPVGPELRLDSPVEAIALTPEGRIVITGRRAGRLHVWDGETDRGFDLPPQGTAVTSLAVSPDGRVFASGTEGGVVRLWDTSMLGPIGQTFKLVSAVTALAFDPAGRILAVGSDDGRIRLWEVPSHKALGVPIRVEHPVQTVAFAADGRRLLIGSTDGGAVVGPSPRSGQRLGPRPGRSVVGRGRSHDRQPRQSDLRDREASRGRWPNSRLDRAPGCGHGEAVSTDAR